MAALRHVDKTGQVFVKSSTQGYDYPNSGLSHTDSSGLPGAKRSINIRDWLGQEEREVDCLSDENGVVLCRP